MIGGLAGGLAATSAFAAPSTGARAAAPPSASAAVARLLPSAPGSVAGFGDAAGLGAPGPAANAREVAVTPTPTDHGYWVATADGRVFAYGDAPYLGSLAGQRLASPIVGMTATPTGHGLLAGRRGRRHRRLRRRRQLRLRRRPAPGRPHRGHGRHPAPATATGWSSADGTVLAYGDAPQAGSLAGQHLASPIVGMAATPTGHGYWLVSADGGIFPYGDAVYHGSLVGVGQPTTSVVAMAATPTGNGYWVLESNGAIFSFGDATYRGAVAAPPATTVVTDLVSTSDNGGYWEAIAPAPGAPPAPAAAPPPPPAPTATAAPPSPSGASLGTVRGHLLRQPRDHRQRGSHRVEHRSGRPLGHPPRLDDRHRRCRPPGGPGHGKCDQGPAPRHLDAHRRRLRPVGGAEPPGQPLGLTSASLTHGRPPPPRPG